MYCNAGSINLRCTLQALSHQPHHGLLWTHPLRHEHRLLGLQFPAVAERSRSVFQCPCSSQVETTSADGPWTLADSGSRHKQLRTDLNVLLVQPEIPQNTGTIARTCAATACALHLVKPLGFEISNTRLKRAGLDYWPHVVVKIHDDWEAFISFFEQLPSPKRMHAYTKFADTLYHTPRTYRPGDWLLFGAETTGLPPHVKERAEASGGLQLKIPIVETHVRSLNLAVAAGIGIYEALRQLDHPHE